MPELVYRLKQGIFIWQLRTLLRKNVMPVQVPVVSRLDAERLKLPSLQLRVSEDIVKKIITGEFFGLNSDRNSLRKCEEDICNSLFSDIKLSDFSLDIRSAWEPARLQHITILLVYLQRYPEISGSDILKQWAKDAVLKWINDNPFLFGLHYISAMECGLRIPVFFYALKSLDNLDSREYQLILDTIHLHAWLVSKRMSLYSSLGNHTVGECVGLIFAGAIFRKTKPGKKWLKTGLSLLKKELDHQIYEDGGPAEQSLNYHRLVLDLYWLCVDFLESNNFYDCRAIKPKLVSGEKFLKTFEDSRGNIPSIGDSDDGYAVAPGISPRRGKTQRENRGIKFFKRSGCSIINTENGATLTFDHGPLGMPPLYNHGHADALSITFTKEGRQLIVDSGTYRYNGSPEWRQYFKGTRAHNTVTIDGLDQAVQETPFIWSKPYKTKLVRATETNGKVLVEAIHDGYSRMRMPVWHQRCIIYFEETKFLIRDTFFGEGIHIFELNYHLHPEASVTKHHDFWIVDNHGVKVFISLFGGDDFVIVKGQKNPLLGWYSPAYGIRRESGVLNCTRRGATKEVSFVTAICTEAPCDPEKLQAINWAF